MDSTMKIENGKQVWLNAEGYLHREDGPAIETVRGTKYWFKNGLLHREDGPAVEYSNGDKKWFLNGKKVEPFIKIN